MVSTTLSRPGQSNGAGDELALFLKVFGGLVMETFDEVNVMMPRHLVRTIDSGKSAQFPAVGQATSAYHTPGDDIFDSANSLMSNIKTAERVISIDEKLVSACFVADIDDAMNHYEVKSKFAKQLGRALAYKADRQLLQVLALAARASQTITEQTGKDGEVLTDAGYGTSGATLAAGIEQAKQVFDEKDVPEEGRFVVLPPLQMRLLRTGAKDYIDRDYAGEGSLPGGVIERIAGFELVQSNHIPQSVIAADSGARNTYDGTFTNTVGLAGQTEFGGTVKLRDLKMETEYSIARQGWPMVASYVMGHGILRPECALEFTTA